MVLQTTTSLKGDTSQPLTKLEDKKKSPYQSSLGKETASDEDFHMCVYVLLHASLYSHIAENTSIIQLDCAKHSWPQPSILVLLPMRGMNHSSYFSRFIKSSMVLPPCLTDFLCVGKVIHRGIPTPGGNTETERWPQQRSPN